MCRNVAVFLFITIKDKDLLTGNEYGMVGTIIRKRVESYTGWWSDGRCIYCAKWTTEVIFKAEYIALLAVLSAEGIVPKLLWTRRVTNGDVISAQKWLPGQKLEPEDMKLERVAKLLKKYTPLKHWCR